MPLPRRPLLPAADVLFEGEEVNAFEPPAGIENDASIMPCRLGRVQRRVEGCIETPLASILKAASVDEEA